MIGGRCVPFGRVEPLAVAPRVLALRTSTHPRRGGEVRSQSMPEPPDDAAVVDRRKLAFCFQNIGALAVIRESFSGAKRATALGVYLTFTEVANRSGGAAARGGFRASRSDIAEDAGVSVDTLDRYAREFVKLGLLEVERQMVGPVNLPNRWALVDVPDGAGAPGGRTGAATPGRTGAAPRARSSQEKKKSKEVEANASSGDVLLVPPPVVKIEGRNVGFDELAAACGIQPSDPNRAGEIAAALNGGRAVKVGIRALVWNELVAQHFDGDGAAALVAVEAEPTRFENALAAMIQRRASQYRSLMSGALITPTALAKWWLTLEGLAAERPAGLSAEDMEAQGG